VEISELINDLTFKAVRSSGAGGQHVNKVASKVELYFNLQDTLLFTKREKERLSSFFNNRINSKGILMLSSSESRSQFRNKALVIQRFLALIEEGLKEEKLRIQTKIPKAVIRKRLTNKTRQSDKKANRKKPDIE
jgi:ribosome-associated protein